MVDGTLTQHAMAGSHAGPVADAWYAVWTRSQSEQVVAEQLSAKGFAAFLPEMDAWSTRGGESRPIRVPMFPGYLFVRTGMDKHRYVEMLNVRGLVRVLGDGWNRLAPVPDADVDVIQRVVAANVPVTPHAHLSYGDRVIVASGPLTGVTGIFVEDRPAPGRLVLSVDLLARSVAVAVDRTDVVPLSSGGSPRRSFGTTGKESPCA